MLTKMMKWVSIIALLSAATFWQYAPTYQLPLRFVVGVGAILVATQAVRAKRNAWATGFCAVAAATASKVGCRAPDFGPQA